MKNNERHAGTVEQKRALNRVEQIQKGNQIKGFLHEMARGKSPGDVYWRIPGRKRPIAYSTKATSDLIAALAEEYGGTIREAQVRINYDQKAKAVLQAYIDRGYGNQIAAEWFRWQN